MKKFNAEFHFLIKILSGLVLLLAIGCSKQFPDELPQSGSVPAKGTAQMNDILNQLDFERGIAIVQKAGSVQDAVDASLPGIDIYIEPGIYKEAININKQDINLIGLGSGEEKVILEYPGTAKGAISMVNDGQPVNFINVKLKNFKENSTGTSGLKCSGAGAKSLLRKLTRQQLANGIAHYTYELKLGNRQFDVVRLHRVIREHSPNHPVRIAGDIFMVHGSIQDFDDIFLTAGAENINAKTSLPVYLASNNIDVWGIDLAWTLVPLETTDFSFMKDWGVERDIDHTLIAMSFARLVRGLTIRNFDKMNLLGFSYGVQIAYGAAGRETQIPKILRNVNGIIPVDAVMKYSPVDEEYRVNTCNAAAASKDAINNGMYQYDAGATFQLLGNLALSTPDDPSPIPDFAGMTNRQVILFMGAMTYLTGNPGAPFEHFTGGDLNDLYYTDTYRFIRLAASLAPYQPQLQLYEFYACSGNEENVSFDDHLGDIKVPILYLGAGGGTGVQGEFTSSLTASTDITNFTASIPGVERAFDYGHADLFLGNDADVLVWKVLYDWLIGHGTTFR
jgi:hypothetical protein